MVEQRPLWGSPRNGARCGEDRRVRCLVRRLPRPGRHRADRARRDSRSAVGAYNYDANGALKEKPGLLGLVNENFEWDAQHQLKSATKALKLRLEIGSTVNIGRPWLDGGTADHLLVSLPYPYGPTLEHLDADGTHVQFLWLVTITGAEAKLVRTDGLEALERLLDTGVDVIDPRRPSLV
ncbi:suppressor of fused domain protein [Actinokineospora sp. HUAS TT18]|uniref:suppressor of fused domain protein n=1 Tax=Actinokineospora sp. HUAS TT18 TaxID=3447451 RepID=UPI003F5225DA